jgi:lipase chaperone LimK
MQANQELNRYVISEEHIVEVLSLLSISIGYASVQPPRSLDARITSQAVISLSKRLADYLVQLHGNQEELMWKAKERIHNIYDAQKKGQTETPF